MTIVERLFARYKYKYGIIKARSHTSILRFRRSAFSKSSALWLLPRPAIFATCWYNFYGTALSMNDCHFCFLYVGFHGSCGTGPQLETYSGFPDTREILQKLIAMPFRNANGYSHHFPMCIPGHLFEKITNTSNTNCKRWIRSVQNGDMTTTRRSFFML